MNKVERRLIKEQNGLVFRCLPCCFWLTMNLMVNIFIILNLLLNMYMVGLFLIYLVNRTYFQYIASKFLVIDSDNRDI